MSSFDKNLETIIDGLLAKADKLNIELVVDDPFEDVPHKEGTSAIVHNLTSNEFGLMATNIEEVTDGPVIFFTFNGKLFNYCKMEGFSRSDMIDGPGFKNKVLQQVDMKNFTEFILK